MTKEDLFNWAGGNMRKYPALDRLCEAEIDGTVFLFLPGNYGVYKGIYLCFNDNPAVLRLRQEGYAVGIISSYSAARKLLLECANYTNRKKRSRKSGKRK